jgi:hypothetical protein
MHKTQQNTHRSHTLYTHTARHINMTTGPPQTSDSGLPQQSQDQLLPSRRVVQAPPTNLFLVLLCAPVPSFLVWAIFCM